jgi:sulfite dehydrogenase (cytochrome) subunit B
MIRTFVLGFAVMLALVAAGFPKSQSIALPPGTIQFKPGPNLGIVQANCLVCHNADYIYFQPALTRAQWTAEVNKMRAAYKATIADGDVPKIVDYLMSQNGKT